MVQMDIIEADLKSQWGSLFLAGRGKLGVLVDGVRAVVDEELTVQ